MSGWAKPGVKCVCVRNTPWIRVETLAETSFGPQFNEQLTIDATVYDDVLGLQLHFVEYPVDRAGHPPLFPAKFFRPLVNEADDLALFAHHLDHVGEPV